VSIDQHDLCALIKAKRDGSRAGGIWQCISRVLVLEVSNEYHVLAGGSLSLISCLKVDCASEKDVVKGQKLHEMRSLTFASASAWTSLPYFASWSAFVRWKGSSRR
jgi:hypothetical protein